MAVRRKPTPRKLEPHPVSPTARQIRREKHEKEQRYWPTKATRKTSRKERHPAGRAHSSRRQINNGSSARSSAYRRPLRRKKTRTQANVQASAAAFLFLFSLYLSSRRVTSSLPKQQRVAEFLCYARPATDFPTLEQDLRERGEAATSANGCGSSWRSKRAPLTIMSLLHPSIPCL